MNQFRVVWRKMLNDNDRKTIWYRSEDKADYMAEILRREGFMVMGKEQREIELSLGGVE